MQNSLRKFASKILTRFYRIPKKYLYLLLKGFTYYFYNSIITHFPSYTLRNFYLKYFLKIKIGKNTAIHTGCFFAGKNIEIGCNNVIARNCHLDGRGGKLIICDNVSIAPETYILTVTHEADSDFFEAVSKTTIIHDYVWIGVRCILSPGVILNKGSVVASGAVVTKDVEEMKIVGGVPAKEIGIRKSKLKYMLNYFPFFNSDIYFKSPIIVNNN